MLYYDIATLDSTAHTGKLVHTPTHAVTDPKCSTHTDSTGKTQSCINFYTLLEILILYCIIIVGLLLLADKILLYTCKP